MDIITVILLIAGSAAGITADVRQASVLSHAATTSEQTLSCPSNQKVTSYRFVGTPGMEIEWGGTSYTIPSHGSIELMSKKNVRSFATAQGLFELPATGPTDPFGILTIDANLNLVLAPEAVQPGAQMIMASR